MLSRFSDHSSKACLIAEGRITDHVEDIVFEDPSQGILRSVVALKAVIERLWEDGGDAVVTTKWDGAPSILTGRDEHGFFVSLKDVGMDRRCRTQSDLDRLYGSKPDLREKMEVALRCLPDVIPSGIYQGDFMFDRRHKKVEMIEGVRHIAFRPNTIVYAVAADSRIGREIAAAEMGIVFHGKVASDNKTVVPMEGLDGLKKTIKVWMRDSSVGSGGWGAIFEEADILEADAILGKVEEMADRVSATAGFLSKQKWWPSVKSFVSSSIRLGVGRFTAEMLMRHPPVVKAEGDRLLRAYADQVNEMFRAHAMLSEVKTLILSRISPHGEIGTFMPSETGLRQTAHEGLMVAMDGGRRRIKLIDRMEFSRNNANLPKEWLR
jgi:hypothetical protein